MGGLTQAFGIATAALSADQQAIDATANNVGNANTPGYTRQVAIFEENDPVTLGGLRLGEGARVAAVDSQRDRVLEQRIQQQQQALAAAGSRLNDLNSLQAIFAPGSGSTSGGTGIGGALNGFFNSLSSLSANPDDATVRQSVVTAAGDLADSFRAVSTQLDQLAAGANANIASGVSAVNQLTQRIARLNQEIQSGSPHGDAGVLEDQRQQAVLELAKWIDVTPIQTENNGLTLTTSGGALLVSEALASPLTTSSVAGVTHVFSAGVDVTSTIHAGSIGGSLRVVTADVPAVRTQLDALAYGLGSAVNAVQASGVDASGAAGAPIFILPASAAGTAASISLAIGSGAGIAAAAVGQGVGDNQNALALANLATAGVVGGVTAGAAYATLAGSLGDSVAAAEVENTSIGASLQQLTTQRNSLSGVSQDEEAAQLQAFERSYQAASKLFSILDSVLSAALNLGVAGVAVQ